jgi:hypothetical protein
MPADRAFLTLVSASLSLTFFALPHAPFPGLGRAHEAKFRHNTTPSYILHLGNKLNALVLGTFDGPAPR